MGFDAVILRQVLAQINHLQLITLSQHTRLDISPIKSRLRRKRNPIKIRRQDTSAISLNSDTLARLLFNSRHKILVDKQRRLPTSKTTSGATGYFLISAMMASRDIKTPS